MKVKQNLFSKNVSPLFFGVLMFLIPLLSGCFDQSTFPLTRTPLESEQHQTESTEKLISQFPYLQVLDKACRELPIFMDVKPERKSISKNNDEIFYYYRLATPVSDVYEAVRSSLTMKNWRFVREGKGIWEHQLEFENDEITIQITSGNFGESNFGTTCRDKKRFR